MKLAVSNIAWAAEEETIVAQSLQRLGVHYVEIAPTKVWPDPLQVTSHEINDYIAFWESYGITIVAFQSMLFTRPDLTIFENPEICTKTLAYLADFIKLADKMRVGVLVFGSPKNRQRGSLSIPAALEIAQPFFADLGRAAKASGTNFCIEPNAPQYACDFITNAIEGLTLVQQVATSGFELHLDTACMTLAGDDIADSIKQAADRLQHFHISSPMLDAVTADSAVDHAAAAATLQAVGYNGYVSIEMRPGAIGENVGRVERAVRFAQATYSS